MVVEVVVQVVVADVAGESRVDTGVRVGAVDRYGRAAARDRFAHF